MGTRADLVAVAEGLAAEARREWEGRAVGLTAELVVASRAAFEAAALAQDIGPGEIAAALGEIQTELEEAGVLSESMELEPAEFLKRTLAAVVHWRRQAEVVDTIVQVYTAMRQLLEHLERDFIAGDTETSRRVAARIRTVLDQADQVLQTSTKETPDGE